MERIKAVIFDMDGVLIDSEAFWKKAEKEVFTSLGVEVTDELCRITETMTTQEVTHFWYDRNPWPDKSLKEIENEVIQKVMNLIIQEGSAMPGAVDTVKKLKIQGYKTGLATNSPWALIPVVLKRLDLEEYFDACSSAEHEPQGKPDPSVYLSIADKLQTEPEYCIAIENSNSGLCAAKKAGMKTISIFNNRQMGKLNDLADMVIKDFSELVASFPEN